MEIKTAILGAGNMGKTHALRIREVGGEVTAICSRHIETRKNFKEATGFWNVQEYSDFEDMLEKGDFDALFICLPPYAQDRQFEMAAAKGKHIFIEKPIALDTNIGKQMVKAAKENHIITYVGFHMRQGTAVKRLKELIISGAAGRPVLFEGQYFCNSLHTPWWRNVDLCGGQIFEQAIHLYDMCRYLMGEPKYTAGIMNNLCHSQIPDYTVEDVSACVAGFMNGAVASITANNCEIPSKWVGKFKAIYENLTADFSDQSHCVITYTKENPLRTEVIEKEEDLYTEEIREFFQCIQKKETTSCDILEGYKSLLFVEKVRESARMDGIKQAIY